MAEKIISPAVITNERDLSFVPQGIAAIGGAFIGPTIKGPAFAPTQVDSFQDFQEKFGNVSTKTYLPYTLQSYLQSAGTATVVRILGLDGYKLKHVPYVIATGSFGQRFISLLHPTNKVSETNDLNPTAEFQTTSITGANASGSAVVTLSGSFTPAAGANPNFPNGSAISCSIAEASPNFIGNIFGSSPEGKEFVYNYVLFKSAASASLAADPACQLIVTSSATSTVDIWDYSKEYAAAETPYIISQTVSGKNVKLFKAVRLSDGDDSNYEVKLAISNIKPAGSVAGSQYGSFTVLVRAVDQNNITNSPYVFRDSDVVPNVIEQFIGVNLDPDSSNYIARVIGDQFTTTASTGKITVNGNYPNRSRYIRIVTDSAVENKAISSELVPFGFEAVYNTIPKAIADTSYPTASFVTAQLRGGIYNKKIYYGFDFGNNDNLNYLKPLPDATAQLTTGSNTAFLLSNYNQNASANGSYSGSINLNTAQTIEDTRKFIVPFQGGFNGYKPNRIAAVGGDIVAGNLFGYDLSSTTAEGYRAYKQAIDSIKNPDEFDFNLLVMPGVIKQHHAAIVTYATEVCEDRGDAFFIVDFSDYNANPLTAASETAGFDSNYVGTYFPWVKILDTNINKPVWVPPSVVVPGAIAFNDSVANPWNAPAGFNRGGLTDVLQAKERLTKEDRDVLYEARVNPIASFPGQGVAIWGQKTLQARPSALDRINVRRLLIAAKKYIASLSRFLVFEQNTATTRNRFLNIANPYFESIQQRQGLYSFRVVMDETNNTPDVIDRNLLIGQIYLQPSRVAEFIVLDFNILPTGAVFPE